MKSAATSLVIFLHGVGSRGSDLAGLGDLWKEALPDTAFAAPNAPHASSFGAGYQWFSVAGVTAENRPARIVEARAAFDQTISTIIAEHGFTGRLDRVALVGFSQGTIMSLDAIASGRWPVAALVGYSGRLASPEPLKPSTATKVLLIHGGADAVIPSDETIKAAASLNQNGVVTEILLIPGASHTITAEGAQRGAAFLGSVFQG